MWTKFGEARGMGEAEVDGGGQMVGKRGTPAVMSTIKNFFKKKRENGDLKVFQ